MTPPAPMGAPTLSKVDNRQTDRQSNANEYTIHCCAQKLNLYISVVQIRHVVVKLRLSDDTIKLTN